MILHVRAKVNRKGEKVTEKIKNRKKKTGLGKNIKSSQICENKQKGKPKKAPPQKI
jgi:hypothetical protein